MLRTRISSPALRAAFTHPAQRRGLASAVLLSSRENWQSRTVKNLKEALVQRGLPQYGNKKALVERLEAYDSQASSVSSATSAAYARSTSGANNASARHISSSAPLNAEAESETPKVQVLTDAEVNLQNVTAPDVAQADPSTVPGVPEKKAQAIDVEQPAYIGAVNIPVYEEVEDQLAIPPFLPDNFAARAEDSMAPPTPDPDATAAQPKVISVAGDAAETARHSLHETVTNLTSDVSEKAEDVVDEAREVVGDIKGKAQEDFPPLSEVLESVRIPAVPLGYITSGLTMPALKGGEEFRSVDRPLNREEKRGAYLLFGILVGGFLLGGVGKKHDSDDKEEHASEKKEDKH
ncbi:hypothetical protein QFC19_007598 [Naganishia cerealis]|uniref:Uncharacterized protein n=1 Tax=Naganishia cerealis TaxID=610337 RepID=A0ACC2V8Q0_9TREE|nr:hypothetical protein QFC19_007598 [Naganishia cerealis]